jgi:hypothetical protein
MEYKHSDVALRTTECSLGQWTIPHVSEQSPHVPAEPPRPESHEEQSQAQFSNPTTGFLTATTFIYALGAGITAAAGTRLALQ